MKAKKRKFHKNVNFPKERSEKRKGSNGIYVGIGYADMVD